MRTLSITMQEDLYDALKHTVSSRQISRFVCEAVTEKLQQKNEALYTAYLAASQDTKRQEELEAWDSLSLETWGTNFSSDK